MIGLLLKELYTLRQYLKTLLFMLVLFAVISAGLDNPSAFLEGFIILMSAMLTISSFSYDEMSKWNRYALAMPLTRKEIVGSKYLLSIVLCLTGAAISFVISQIVLIIKPMEEFGLREQLLTVGAILCVAFIFIGLLMPLTFQFGVEKSRLLMILVFATPTAGILVLSKMGIPMPSESSIITFAKVIPVFTVALYVLSYWISVKIFSGKEL